MSKKGTPKQNNTLLNYFLSPKSKCTPNKNTTKLEANDEELPKKMDLVEGSDDEPCISQTKKRNRVIDSDSEDEQIKPTENTLKKSNKKVKKEPSDEETNKKPKANTKIEPLGDIVWPHETLSFLKPDVRRDIKKRKVDDPEYDPYTLFVPDSHLNSLTPAMRQWWVLKSQYFDTVLFFKVGKFYELYHMDAVIGVKYLNISFMKGGAFAHSGFPEIAYGRMSQSLVEHGFKVARVEQTETPEMMANRLKQNKKSTKFDKVVNREICQISMKGTCVYGPQSTDPKSALHTYMLAIAEKNEGDHSIKYGICFVDTSIGVFHMAEFADDRHCSKLLVLLSQHPPALVLVEGSNSNMTQDILRKNSGSVRVEKLVKSTQFLNAEKTIQKLRENGYFENDKGDFTWPKVLEDFIEDGSCKSGYELTMSALGACLWYLINAYVDIQVFTRGKFEVYEPVIQAGSKVKAEYMVLDSVTIQNLNLLGKTGTMQKRLDLCCTSFGKRLLVQWICRPLCSIEKIVGRQEAIKELVNNTEYLRSARHILKKLPDLDRQLMKINTFGNKLFATKHPDSRAIFYESQTYFKRKIYDLVSTLRGFENALEISRIFKGCESRLLKKITHHQPDGMFLDLTKSLDEFKTGFDQEQAEKERRIVPQAGIDVKYDAVEAKIKNIQQELDDYLEEQKQIFKCNIVYFGNDKKRYQLEIPLDKCKKLSSEYSLESCRKGGKPVNRYSTSHTKELLANMMRAESERSVIIQDLNRRIFEKFGESYEDYDQVSECLAMLDVLCSLAEYARTYSQDICLPKILPFSDKPLIKFENGRHPCIPKIDDYVPNDTELGTKDKPAILILTGPNMGGKSTLMRQAALIIIMAQMGSYVPASECELSLVDRIFTRLGAHDDIMSGQSTFFIELSEAGAILQHATKHSFVLVDELGRGTSTHDGNAIAMAYMRELLDISCRVIYSTHYHILVDHYGGKRDGRIQLGHMTCLVENEGESSKETVTFLYKFEQGVCPNSYGFNVAKLAGMPSCIVERARHVAAELESINAKRHMFVKLFSSKDAKGFGNVLHLLRNMNL